MLFILGYSGILLYGAYDMVHLNLHLCQEGLQGVLADGFAQQTLRLPLLLLQLHLRGGGDEVVQKDRHAHLREKRCYYYVLYYIHSVYHGDHRANLCVNVRARRGVE